MATHDDDLNPMLDPADDATRIMPPARPQPPVAGRVPATYAGPPSDYVREDVPEEPEGRDWMTPAIALGVGLLVGALSVFFLTRDRDRSAPRAERLSGQLERSVDRGDRLESEVTELKKRVASDRLALEQREKNDGEALVIAQTRTNNLEEALDSVADEEYEVALEKVKDDGELSKATVRAAVADNLAARALAAVVAEDRVEAESLVEEGRSYPDTELAETARDAVEGLEDVAPPVDDAVPPETVEPAE